MLLFGTFITPDAFRNKISDDIKAWMAEKIKPPKTVGTLPVFVAPDIAAAYRRWIQDRCQYMDIDKPLMLAAICILYHDGRELPGQRAELYKNYMITKCGWYRSWSDFRAARSSYWPTGKG